MSFLIMEVVVDMQILLGMEVLAGEISGVLEKVYWEAERETKKIC